MRVQGSGYSEVQLRYLGSVPTNGSSARRMLLQSASGIDVYYNIEKACHLRPAPRFRSKPWLRFLKLSPQAMPPRVRWRRVVRATVLTAVSILGLQGQAAPPGPSV